ncbi:HNH endonuclease [Allokutzneria sp. A3M-2-11 16]|uniref:HNH endonuclease signature motif containing protein n=1 Tax=Allokutzneria sp. A3M-2-11 16 TaxID=2962043 RepID=UPI0020B850A5|nr:HNH endonuclease signature motif containing protein [Allokutzneria sp. A3M-2-11 16]MCP3800817.1 HNH endonuclease [Allokutzneria sp. A3M-2-11 16]
MLDTKAITDMLTTEIEVNDSYRLSEKDHVVLLKELERISNLLTAVKTDVATHAEERGLHTSRGCKDLAVLLRSELNIAPAEAHRRKRLVHELPKLPTTREAVYTGAISGEHALVISDAIKRIPEEYVGKADAALAKAARKVNPRDLMVVGKRVRQHVDPDGVYRDEQEAIARRSARMGRDQDGCLHLKAMIDPINGEKIWNFLSALAKPKSVNGEKDPRRFEQRLADAFIEAMTMAMSIQDIPGLPRTLLIITMGLDDLEHRTGCGETHTGQPMSADLLRQTACDTTVIPIVLSGEGEPLAYGRERRLASLAQKRALAVRDKGCAFPGCDRPPSWTEAHHVVHWIDGGPTDLNNLVLLCVHHHHVIHDQDWEIVFDHGIPAFIPPKWIDPDQAPLRNIRVDHPLKL